MTTFVLVSLASKKLDSQKPQFMLSETVFSTKNLKPSSVHCKNTSKTNMEGAVLWAVIEKSLQAEKARFNSRATLPKSCFVSVDKLLLMASHQVAFKISKTCET